MYTNNEFSVSVSALNSREEQKLEISKSMALLLQRLEDGRPLRFGLYGRACHGSANNIVQPLREAGYISGSRITQEGRRALHEYKNRFNKIDF